MSERKRILASLTPDERGQARAWATALISLGTIGSVTAVVLLAGFWLYVAADWLLG
jgi:hypothetical protein